MRAVVQRIKYCSVTIDGDEKRSVGPGILVLLGVKDTDTPALCAKMAEKCAGLRIFEDAEGKMNLSAEELGYSAMVISNFTLYGDAKKGKRPSFIEAAKPPLSVDCYEEFLRQMQARPLREVQSGTFGAEMQVELVNDGPVTIILEME